MNIYIHYLDSNVPQRFFARAFNIRNVVALTTVTILALAFVTSPQSAQAQDQQNSILGKVTNGTEGGVLPDDLEVILMSIDVANNQIIEQETITVDEDGIFGFSNLVSGPGLVYRVVVNAESYTPSLDMSTVEDWQNVSMSIYDETTSLDDITVSSYVMMVPTIDARSRQAGVLTVINVDNRGDRIWIPDLSDPNLTGLDLLRFNLPEGYSDLAIESELPNGNVLEIPTGFALTNPVPPGEAAILISYIITYEGDGFDFTLKLPYGADQVRTLLPDDAGEISAEGFGTLESVFVADNVFNQFEGNNYAKGDEFLISYSGLPQPKLLQTVSDFFQGRTYVVVIIWIIGVAMLGILVWAIYSSRKRSDQYADDDGELVGRSDFLAEIAALDDEFEANKIDEDEYNEQREELKRLILEFDEIESDSEESSEEPSDEPKDEGESDDTPVSEDEKSKGSDSYL
ncbi:MAG TPA: hypothetical protein DHV68_06140 [Dehalococcoidia bacterium]|nr:hypothetical protein [Chloroflexota bacterium]HCI86409.1 hypothetical protein [Dehalococcoidia bacterium]|tara:strand:- start:2410 stop:3783 length:1374 start_codon:yes stop_codon:yes gene_type:complete